MAIIPGTPQFVIKTSGFPTTFTMSHDAGGADALIVFLYCNENGTAWVGGDPALTFGGVAMTRFAAAYQNIRASQGRFWVYYLANPGSGAKTLTMTSIAQSNGDMLAWAIPVNGVDTAAPVSSANGASWSSGATFAHAAVTDAVGAYALDIDVKYFGTNIPVCKAPAGFANLATNTGSSFKASVNGAAFTGSVQFSYTVDSFNNGTGYTVGLKAGATGPPAPAAPCGWGLQLAS